MSGLRKDPHTGKKKRAKLEVRDFYRTERADQIARRNEVWGLLKWYHHNVVLPNMGVLGFVRRWRKRIFGQRIKLQTESGKRSVNIELLSFLSPWAEVELKTELARIMKLEEEASDDDD